MHQIWTFLVPHMLIWRPPGSSCLTRITCVYVSEKGLQSQPQRFLLQRLFSGINSSILIKLIINQLHLFSEDGRKLMFGCMKRCHANKFSLCILKSQTLTIKAEVQFVQYVVEQCFPNLSWRTPCPAPFVCLSYLTHLIPLISSSVETARTKLGVSA